MPDQLLATKFHIPHTHSNLVARPHLIERLNNGVQRGHRLTLVSAPAGFGKTTLVANWIDAFCTSDHLQKCWLALDQGDNAPTSFVIYFISALQTANVQIGTAARATLESPQPPPLESVLVSLINDVTTFAEPVLLVLDDYHVITTPEIHHALDFFVEHLPSNLHLVLTTREDPPLSLARLRARGQLSEIRAADLQFSKTETDEFLNQLMSLGLEAEDVAALSDRTEGWIAGLRLATLALENENDKHGFINAFTASHRFLTDYLLDEVLARQDPALHQFLLRTSVLHRFCAALCDRVVGENSGAQTLRHLEQSNLFLVPLDRERQWYRYHHLFAQFLQLRLKESEPDLIPELHHRAMDWCIAQGLEREALTYALEMRDYARATELIEALSPQVINYGGVSQVLEWLAALPETLVHERPYLCLFKAWALSFTGKMVPAAEYLAAAETACAVEKDENQKTIILGYVAADRAYQLFFQGTAAQAIHQARQALAQLPAHDDVMRSRTATVLANSLRYVGDFPAALEAHSIASTASDKSGNLFTAAFNFASLGELHRELGQLHRAMAILQQGLEFTRQRSGRSDIPITDLTYFLMGAIEREWNHLDLAKEYVQQGATLCREWQQAVVLAVGLMSGASLYQDLSEYDTAREMLEEARRIIGDFSPWGIAMVNALIAQVDLARGDVAAASRWMQASKLSISDEIPFVRRDEYQTLAQTLLAQENCADALIVFDKIYQMYKSAGRVGYVVQVLPWRARGLAELGHHTQALNALKEAIALGATENYVRSFVNAGQPIADLLRQLPASDYRNQLLDAFPDMKDSHPRTIQSNLSLAEGLNEREIAVLRRMAAGMSNQEIGAELYLSTNTIRWYASQIYLKLGVKSRGEAGARGHDLGIL